MKGCSSPAPVSSRQQSTCETVEALGHAPCRRSTRVRRFGSVITSSISPRTSLRSPGRAVKLERRPMDLLILLVENRRQLVSRSDIVNRLWGKDMFVDVETGVNTAISQSRAGPSRSRRRSLVCPNDSRQRVSFRRIGRDRVRPVRCTIIAYAPGHARRSALREPEWRF